MQNNHARLSPSGAVKWMGCPASLAAERGIPEKRSEHAAEGTAAHAVAEYVLRATNPRWRGARPEFSRLAAADWVGETVERWRITDDMAPPIQSYVDAVLAIADGKTLHVEQRVDFSHIVGVRNSFGTADAIVINGDELQIHDLKFGRGVKVDAENNPQLMIYALGALKVFELGTDFNTVRLFIHQPRLNHVSEWAVSVKELRKFGRQVKAAATVAIKLYDQAVKGIPPEAHHFNPSEKACRWCKAAGTCTAAAARVYEMVAAEFVDLDAAEFEAKNPLHLTPEQLAQAHANLDFIESWCGKVKKAVYDRLLSGGGLPGLKLVQGRPGNRKWADEREAEIAVTQLLECPDELYTAPKLVTPTQAEKLLKHNSDAWEALQALVVRPAGAPVVVPATDPRAALVVDEFEDVTHH